MTARGRRALGVLAGLTVMAGLLTAPPAPPATAATAAEQQQQPVAQKPYLGWSSWTVLKGL
ncbi:hypothetical protein [Amycolatopsis sp. NPDC051061]|uniref:hypothetical protein n=1 Tax=Amycolatopsis sp. NPDC051061 TaxID=3155042 RepID=UPI003448C134